MYELSSVSANVDKETLSLLEKTKRWVTNDDNADSAPTAMHLSSVLVGVHHNIHRLKETKPRKSERVYVLILVLMHLCICVA